MLNVSVLIERFCKRCQATANEQAKPETGVCFGYISALRDSVYVYLLHCFSTSEKDEIKWHFHKASTIIDSIEKRMDAVPAYKDLITLLQTIKSHLADFERTSKINKEFLNRSFSVKQDQPSNREVINRKEPSSEVEGIKTFKGHKVIQITDDFEGIVWNCLISLIPVKYV